MKKLLLVSAVLTATILYGCSGGDGKSEFGNSNKKESEDPPTSVETIDVSTSDISKQIKSFGNIRAQEIVEVQPQVSNRITRINAQLGDTVQQGELLAKIYDGTYSDQYQQAKSQMEQSKSSYVRDSLTFKRQKKLFNRDLISSTEFEESQATFQNSKAAYQSAKSSLSESRENLNNTEIRSPVYGVILSRDISEGDLASTGQTAYEIGNLVGYQARVNLPLEEWKQVKIGQPVDFKLSNRSNISGQGRVTHKSPRLDASTGLGEVVISLTKGGNSIYQGVLVQSIINVEKHNNALVIPRSALVEKVQTLIEPETNSIQLERKYSVFAVKDDSIAIEKKVKLGIEQGDRIEITSGLSADDEIVITGQSGLSDSAKVRIADPENFQPSSEEDVPINNMKDQDADSTSQEPSSTS